MFEELREPLGRLREISQRLRPAVESSIRILVVEALERWAVNGFVRADDGEVAFTAAVIGWMEDIKREQGKDWLHILPEQYQYSSEVLAGRASPARAPRIDIVVRFGDFSRQSSYIIECKRIGPGRLVREYVDEGIHRYKSGKYADDAGTAAMLGYVVGGDPQELWELVNQRMQAHDQFTDADALAIGTAIGSLETVYHSSHARPAPYPSIHLVHLLFDVRMRPPFASVSPSPTARRRRSPAPAPQPPVD